MKYSEFIHVNETFNPVFDLENEEGLDWSIFISNDKFRDVLSSVMDSMNPQKQKNPIWLRGTYGTGKSHATSVIKHLLCDDEIPDYFDLEDNQLTAKLHNFRENNKVFPVVIKGTSTIGTPQRFRSTIQSAVKKALKQKNMNVTVQSDFEHMISLLKSNTIQLTDDDYEGTDIEDFKDSIIPRLEDEESRILIGLEEILLNKGISSFAQDDIVHWLIEVRNELKKKEDIDYLMIFWDEFTGALSLLNVEEILLEIQNIAEAKSKGLSLFIVSHRTRSDNIDINSEKIEKIMDRFEKKHYTMEPVTTYDLIAKSIKKDKGWEEIRDSLIDKVENLIDKISLNDGSKVKDALKNLYPIHPYTAYLATFIAQEIGSTDRSIFKFLHDDTKYGFKSFINTYEIDERFFLTSEYLWDFFYETFEQREDEKTSGVIRRYKLYYNSLNEQGEEYLTIFKVILLLNILYKIAGITKGSLAIPSRDNIKEVFVGSIYQDKVDYVLKYIDENGIVNESPDHLFELTTNALPPKEINDRVNTIKNNLTLNNLLGSDKLKEIEENISKKVNRGIEIEIKDANINATKLRNDLERGIFKKDGYLHMLYFLSKSPAELDNITQVVESISDISDLNNVIVVISDAVLPEKALKEYVTFKARAFVAEKHNYGEDVEINNKHADMRIKKWVTDIKSKPVKWYLNGEENRSEIIPFAKDILNTEVSKKIFYHGLENITILTKNENLWTHTFAKTLADKYVTSRNLDELSSNLKGLEFKSLDVLKDNNGEWIIKNNFEFKDNVPEEHPIKVMQDYVDEKLTNAQKNGTFNLGNTLKGLSKSPYGLYPNRVNIPALSFVLRKYVHRLYDDKGNSINEYKMKEKVIQIFELWTNNKKEDKLVVRLGSIVEKELSDSIKNIFELDLDSDEQSIITVRWKLREWLKSTKKAPLWLFKYSNESNPKAIKAIESLSEFLRPNLDDNLSDNLIQNCYDDLEPGYYDLQQVIKKDTSELFKNFVSKLTIRLDPIYVQNIIDNNLEELKEYIISDMPEEIYDWDEIKVKSKITDRIYEIHQKESESSGESDISGSSTPSTQPNTNIGSSVPPTSVVSVGGESDISGSSTPSTQPNTNIGSSVPPKVGNNIGEEQKDIIHKVKKADPEKLKKVIIEVLTQNEDIQRFFKDYL